MEANSQLKNKKQALGRGLGSLLGVDNMGTSRESSKEPPKDDPVPQTKKVDKVYHVAVEKLVANKNQPRRAFEAQTLQSLANSIKQKGILQPIIVRPSQEDQFEIIAGERRWRAAQMAGLHEVPVILKAVDNQNTLELALIENIQREDLNAIEEAEAYSFLIEKYNLTHQELATALGMDRVSVSNTLRLLNLSHPVQKMVRDSKLLKGQAKILVSISEPNLQLEIAEKIVSEKMSVRAAEKFIAQKTSALGNVRITEKPSQKFVQNLCEELQKVLGTKVNIGYNKGKGQLSIYYYSDEELNQLVDRLKSWNS